MQLRIVIKKQNRTKYQCVVHNHESCAVQHLAIKKALLTRTWLLVGMLYFTNLLPGSTQQQFQVAAKFRIPACRIHTRPIPLTTV